MTSPGDPLRYFRVEARDIAEAMGRDLLRLEQAPEPDLVPRLLRLAHTLKGAARVVGQREIAEAAHVMEEALAPLRDPAAIAPRAAIDTLLARVDDIAARVAALTPPAVAADAPPRPRGAPADEAPAVAEADIIELDAVLDAVAEARLQLRGVRRLLADAAAAPLAAGRGRILAGIDEAERELNQAHAAGAKLRLAAAGSLFAILERTARDIAKAEGKEVAFAASGGDIRLDGQVLRTLRGALIQLVRNAVAHGIELPAERRRRDKPDLGQVAVEIIRRGSRIAFICRDDGGGIDLDAVRRVARERGVARETLAALDPAGLVALLLKGGLTTAATANEIAGRGIGLDVARAAVERLGGEIAVETNPGQGTRIELIVPVQLSAVEALLVEAGGATIAIPLAAVRRIAPLTARGSAHVAEGSTIAEDGKAIALAPLARLLRLSENAPCRLAVIIAGATAMAALEVERIVGTASLVMQPPARAPIDPIIAGAALDHEGLPQLVLDPDRAVAAAWRARAEAPNAAQPIPAAERKPILVIDDSLTTRMLELSILESAGYRVELAVSAEEGLLKAARGRYGLFLVDVEMPGMDGFGFVERTRADPGLGKVPALLVSSRNAPEDRSRAAAAGASGYIVKGEFDQNRFLETVGRLVG